MKKTRLKQLSDTEARSLLYAVGITAPTPEQIKGIQDVYPIWQSQQRLRRLLEDQALQDVEARLASRRATS
jgi:hypothetical protein